MPKMNEWYLTEEFVRSHVTQIEQQPLEHVYRLTFLTSEFALGLKRPRILDVACGAAHALTYFQAIFSRFEYVGLDFSVPMLKEARALYPGAELICFEFERSFLFRDDSVDLVFVRDFFEHVERPYDLLSECLRVTRRYVLFNFRCCKMPDDLVLVKVNRNIRFNLLSLERFLDHLRAQQGCGLKVRMCATLDQPYCPPIYVCPSNPDWVRDLDRGGVKKIDVLVEKTRTGTIEIEDCTVARTHKYFLSKRPVLRSLARRMGIGILVRKLRAAWYSPPDVK